MRKIKSLLLTGSMFFAGVCLLLVPVLQQRNTNVKQQDILDKYAKQMETIEKKQLETCLSEANMYNNALANFSQAETTDIFDKYEQILNLEGDGMMGSIEIPKLDLHLPIYHGTSEEVLQKGVGHLYGSSLPIGGRNSHCVLTGHRGVPGAKLFTGLGELEIGDLFFVRVCGKKHEYRVSVIRVVSPEDTKWIRIQDGKDLISLVTCTPYGVNTHRLIITGERVKEVES